MEPPYDDASAAMAAAMRAIAFPAGTDVLTLARAWFLDAAQLREPQPGRPRRLVGARFGGSVETLAAVPGLVQVTAGVCLRGPHPRSVLDQALPATVEDLYLIEETAAEPDFSSWCRAAARHAGGAVVDHEGRVLLPTTDEMVGYTLFARSMPPAEIVLERARTVAPMMRYADQGGPNADGFVLATPYDGRVLLSPTRRAELPVALTWLDDDAYGPFAFALSWTPPNAAAAAPNSVVGGLARERIVPMLARLVLALHAGSGGTVVDAAGFVVPLEAVRLRASR